MWLKNDALTNGDADWTTSFKHPQPPSAQGNETCYSTTMFTAEATRLIAAHNADDAAHPFFLYLALQAVHEPVEVPPRYSEPLRAHINDTVRRTYAGMVSAVDEGVANITAALEAKRMGDNTILVLSNDNGGWCGYGGLNYPYRGHKTTLWEGGVRGLGFVWSPGRIKGGTRFGGLFHVTDWLPTLVAAAGADAAALGKQFASLDGVDQWAALQSAAANTDTAAAAFPRTELLHNIEGVSGTGAAVLRVGAHKLFVNMQAARGFDGWCAPCADPNGCAVPDGAAQSNRTVAFGGQLCCWQPPVKGATTCTPYNRTALPPVLLYDIDADPSETTDVAAAKPEVVRSMLTRLAAYNATNAPCCICTGSSRVAEMDEPPLDGYWYSFRDQSPNPDANCALMNEPPWRESGAVEAEAR